MADAERSLFFADSDDEDMENARNIGELASTHDASVIQPLSTPPAPKEPSRSALFLPDSDEDDEMAVSPQLGLINLAKSLQEDVNDVDVDIPQSEHHRASSVSSLSSSEPFHRESSPASSVDISRVPEPPNKKRKISFEVTQDKTPLTSAYLGSFLVANAWSTARGKGYIKVRVYLSRTSTLLTRIFCMCAHISAERRNPHRAG